jgi:two-component system OmpR family sensor kinase
MSIRFRLTLLYSVILVLALIAFGTALYASQAAAASARSQALLVNSAQAIRNFGRLPGPPSNEPARRFARAEIYAQVRSIDGTVVDRSPNLEGITLPLSDEALRKLQSGDTWLETTQLASVHLMVYSAPSLADGRVTGVIQVARSLAEQDQALQELQRILLIAGAIATLVAFGLGWVFAGTALHPIGRLTETARIIGAERDFGRRVEYTGPNDEIGQLAATFNTMLTELQSAYHQTEQTLQIQRRFVADASHELRTPLTIIRGNLGLLRRDPPISAADRRDVLNDTVEESERLIRLVHSLLMLARSDAGRVLRHEVVQIGPLIDELCRQTRALEPERTLTCEAVPASVIGDRDALKQVLVILLDNARKFTPPQGRIDISSAVIGDTVTLRVRDTGCGIAPAALPHIFERFYRGDSARTGGGAGLGLAIAAALVEAMQGQITVESRVGVGSTFSVGLPQAPTIGALPEPTNGADRELEHSAIRM